MTDRLRQLWIGEFTEIVDDVYACEKRIRPHSSPECEEFADALVDGIKRRTEHLSQASHE